MRKWGLSKKLSLKTHIIPLIVVLLLVAYMGITFFIRTPLCPNNQGAASVHPLWKINASTVNATLLWEYRLTIHDSFLAASKSSVAFYRGNSVNACGDDEAIIALNPTTGKEVWRYPVTILYSLFGYEDGFLIASCCTVATKLDTDGKYVWKTAEFPEKAFNSKFIINDNKVYFSSGEQRILDLDSGVTLKDRFLTPEDFTRFDIHYAPQYGVYLRLDPDKILVFQIDGGLPAWEMREKFKANPILVDNRVITLDQSNTIQLFDIQNGKQMGEIKLTANGSSTTNESSSQFATLAANGNTIFILDRETSRLLAIRLD